MAYEIKDNTASLFSNDKREKDSHPHWKGTGKVGGKEYWVSGWVKKTKNGDDWVSISLKEKDAVNADGVAKAKSAIPPKPAAKDGFVGDDIPW
jgi:uncharacterized protein (DUF736 family)